MRPLLFYIQCRGNYYSFLFKITKAPITPGTQPQQVSNNTINTEPQPLSITAKGGKNNANNTRRQDIMCDLFIDYNASDGAFAAGENTIRCTQWQWRIQNRIAYLMTP